MAYFGVLFSILGFLIIVSSRTRMLINQKGPEWLIRLYLLLCVLGKMKYAIISLILMFISFTSLIIIPPTAWETELPLGSFAIVFWLSMLFLALLIISLTLMISKISIELSDKFVSKHTKGSAPVQRFGTFMALFGFVQILIGGFLYIDTVYFGSIIHGTWEFIYFAYLEELKLIFL